MGFNVQSGKLIEGDRITNEPVPSGVTEICENSFLKSNETLKKLAFSGSTLEIIGESAFKDCIYLEEVDFSNCYVLEKISRYAFWGCTKLSILKLTSSINWIGTNAFRGCCINAIIDLTNIDSVGDSFLGNPMSFTAEDSSPRFRMYENNIYTTDYSTLYYVSYSSKELKLHPSTTIIGSCSFSTCSFKEVIIPPQITQINGFAFHNTLHLEHLTLSPNVKTIVTYEICANPQLISLMIPEGVEKVESSSILSNPKLRYIKIPETLTNISRNSFSVPFSIKYVTYKRNQFKALIEGGIPKHALLIKTCNFKHSIFKAELIFMILFISS